jgi:hypothetical protein
VPEKFSADGIIPKTAAMTWDQFAEAKKRTQRDSIYGPFILGMKIKTVYDASATFPKVKKAETLRSAVYGQAKKLGRKVSVLIQDGKVFVALTETPTAGKER